MTVSATEPDAPNAPCPAIALIVFNRPDYTAQVVESIRVARPSKLFVIADGPRFGYKDDVMKCAAVRRLVDTAVDWPCDVIRIYSDTNLGCASRVASGLEAVFAQVEQAIILEDDCVAAPSFFPFCADLLSRFRDRPEVGMIAGTNYRLTGPASGEAYFISSHHSIWGWATWRKCFDGFDPQMTAWRRTVHPADLANMWTDGRSRRLHLTMFDAFREGAINSWDIPWIFHLASRRLRSAVPSANLVSNIGVDGVRGRAGDSNNFLPAGSLEIPMRHPEVIKTDTGYDAFVASRHRLYRDWTRALWSARLRRLLGIARKSG